MEPIFNLFSCRESSHAANLVLHWLVKNETGLGPPGNRDLARFYIWFLHFSFFKISLDCWCTVWFDMFQLTLLALTYNTYMILHVWLKCNGNCTTALQSDWTAGHLGVSMAEALWFSPRNLLPYHIDEVRKLDQKSSKVTLNCQTPQTFGKIAKVLIENHKGLVCHPDEERGQTAVTASS